jgi:hypothetical protein
VKGQFVSSGIWRSLTKSAKTARKPSFVAVAYFGKGASKLLPLPPDSHLVVDASEDAVKKGQTHPDDLKLLQKRDVVVFSSPSLHAKVYVFENLAFVGSANASNRSAKVLTEAIIKTSDRSVVRAAKAFVKDKCLDELSPGRLEKLQKLYRPPQFPDGTSHKGPRPEIPRLRLAQLKPIDGRLRSYRRERPGGRGIPTQEETWVHRRYLLVARQMSLLSRRQGHPGHGVPRRPTIDRRPRRRDLHTRLATT